MGGFSAGESRARIGADTACGTRTPLAPQPAVFLGHAAEKFAAHECVDSAELLFSAARAFTSAIVGKRHRNRMDAPQVQTVPDAVVEYYRKINDGVIQS